jgi:hypothetical protein
MSEAGERRVTQQVSDGALHSKVASRTLLSSTGNSLVI